MPSRQHDDKHTKERGIYLFMGTLFDQRPRPHFNQLFNPHTRLSANKLFMEYLLEIKEAAKKSGLTVDQVLKAIELIELNRSNDIAIYDGDVKDEQLGGFGILAKELIGVIEEIQQEIKEIKDLYSSGVDLPL